MSFGGPAASELSQGEHRRRRRPAVFPFCLDWDYPHLHRSFFATPCTKNGSTTGPHWLKEDRIAKIWSDALFHFDGDRYKIICSTIMSNHAHFIFYKLDRSLAKIMKTMKGFSAFKANKLLNRTGERFWQIESFDRMVRDRTELKYRINYVLNNSVEAGIVPHWKDYKHNYIHPDFLKFVD